MKTKIEYKKRLGKTGLLLALLMLMLSTPTYAHCDSYDGPVIQDALIALDKEDVSYVMKWIVQEQETEIANLFWKTIELKEQDAEIYTIVEKHFLETLVRLHRETEGAPYTGLKPAGSTAPIIQMADTSIENKEVDTLLTNLNKHIQHVISEKFEKVNALEKMKNNSVEEGRAYVVAYVDYTHTLEAIEAALAGGGHH